jgi:hypothetical protein
MNQTLNNQINVMDYLRNFSHAALGHHQMLLGNHHLFLNTLQQAVETLSSHLKQHMKDQTVHNCQIAYDLQQHHSLLQYLWDHDKALVSGLDKHIHHVSEQASNESLSILHSLRDQVTTFQTQYASLKAQVEAIASNPTSGLQPSINDETSTQRDSCPSTCPCSSLETRVKIMEDKNDSPSSTQIQAVVQELLDPTVTLGTILQEKLSSLQSTH